ncbi:MAG TPA: AMP-binding protein [Candidatus Thermoplasmatota archaeon]|nr:AMP-binding protein [Candidatus Thermoplasmatota archaeon]
MSALHELCVDRHPEEAPALLDAHHRYTFGELREMSARLATHLRHAESVAPGERVVLVLPQRLETALLHVACSRIGAISVPLSPLFGPDGLATRMGDARPALAVTLAAHAGVVREALRLAALDAPLRLADDALFEARWTSARPMERAEEARASEDAPLTLVYTSGTTARPKGALLPHRVVPGRMPGFRLAHEPLERDAVFYSPADWSWIGGLHDSLFAPWHEGVAVAAHERHGALDAQECYRFMEERGVTDAFFPPTALKLLARAGASPPLRLRTLHSAGEPLAPPVAAWARAQLADAVAEVYGLTECAFLVGSATRAYETPEGSMGRAFPTHRVEVVDEELCVREGDPTMMLGYWRGPDAPPELPLDAQGLLHTGDLAREHDGFLWFLGRKDDLIKTSGYRVGPAEVEATLLAHAAVAECAVVGVPDEARGQRVKAFVKRAAPVTAEELMAFVKARLAAHAYPREIEFVDALPMTASGKLKRRELRGRG